MERSGKWRAIITKQTKNGRRCCRQTQIITRIKTDIVLEHVESFASLFYIVDVRLSLVVIPDLSVMWDGMAITFAKMGLRDFFLDAKRSVYVVFLVQS